MDLRKANTTGTSAEEGSKIRRVVTQQQYKGIGNVEEFQIQKDHLNSNNLVFSGTDNVLVTMTESVGMSFDRFKFHLELYNKFSVLSEDSSPSTAQESDQHSAFYELPVSLKIHAAEVQYGTGALSRKVKLQKQKRRTDLDIIGIEKTMAENSITEAYTIRDMESRFEEQKKHRLNFRRFYYSKGRSNDKYTYELQKRKYTDRLCSQERRFMKQNPKNGLVMFIGDRGTGVGCWVF
ncbi:unnamed protein product [Mucor hiemalis]